MISAASKKKLVRRNTPYINLFGHEAPYLISAMRDLMVVLFEHIEITSIMDLDLKIKYTKKILIGPELNKY